MKTLFDLFITEGVKLAPVGGLWWCSDVDFAHGFFFLFEWYHFKWLFCTVYYVRCSFCKAISF